MTKKGFKLTVDLESYYGDKLWLFVQAKGWLESITEPERVLSPQMIRSLFSGNDKPFDGVGEIDKIRLLNKFTDSGKQAAAKYILGLDSEEKKIELQNFSPLITDVRRHLGL